MNCSYSLRLRFVLASAAAALCLLPGLRAQSTAETTPPAKKAEVAPKVPETEEIVTLSPFVVNTSNDNGFIAASALAGGRLATPLNDTPAAYSVETREFIDAVNISDLSTAIKWTVDANNINDDGRGVMFADEQSTKYSFRGMQANQQQIDFFPVYYDYDSYNIQRFDFARGPNSILFGNGSDGGTPNATIKQAQFGKAFRQIRASYGSWKNERLTIDVNQPLTKTLAMRVNTLWQDSDGWRDRTYYKKMAGALALTYSPWVNTTIRFAGDYGRFDRNLALDTLGDRLSGWDGTTVFSSRQSSAPSAATGTRLLGGTTAATAYPVFIPGQSTLMNWGGMTSTVGGNNSGPVPVGGVAIPTGFASGNYAGGPILDTVNLPSNAFNVAQANSGFRVPGRAFTVNVNGNTFTQTYDTYTLSADQKVGSHLFLNIAANYTSGQKTTDYTMVRGLNDVYIDTNRNLPNGAANPNFLVPYDESVRYKNLTNFVAHNYRASAAYVLDHTRFGDFRLNTQIGENKNETPRMQYSYAIKEDPDPRQWALSKNVITYRYYWNQYSRPEDDIGTITYTDPTGGTRTVPTGWVLDATRQNNTSRTISDFKYGQAALSSTLLSGKLNLLLAGRTDKYAVTSDQSMFRQDYGTAWDGVTYKYRPRPPADYFTLRYTPKDSSGNPTGPTTLAVSRPRDGSGNPLPQYANDRFEDDYSTPRVAGTTNTYSTGAVYHVTPWVSAFVNYAETFNPPSPAIRLTGGVFDPLLSKGYDAGLRFNLLHDKIVVTLTQFSAKQKNVALGTGTGNGFSVGLSSAFNAVIDASPKGEPRPDVINNRGVQEVPFVYSDTGATQTKGYELEVVANPLVGWRVIGNFSAPKATQSDAYADTRSYLAANDTVFRQILADAGVLIDSSNVASVDPTVPIVAAQNTKAIAAAKGWNDLQANKANFVAQSQEVTRLAKLTANLFTDYTLQSGALKDLRIGGGINYRGKEVIGYRGADTIVDPTNPAKAIDDPSVNALTPVYRKSYYTAMAVVGYTYKFSSGRRLKVDFTVDNLFDEDKPLYYNTVQRPPNGDLSSPARVATPFQFSYLTPRSYQLSATLDF